jgi:uncharacterized membrane protein
MAALTIAGAIHATLALFAIGAGALQLWRRKGDSAHRAIGYAYVYALLVADGAAMLIWQFTGALNILHFGVLANLICIAVGMSVVLKDPRPPRWRVTHYMWMSWSYVGVLAAAATELSIRTVTTGRWQAWAATIVATAGVTALGKLLIDRHRPVVGA